MDVFPFELRLLVLRFLQGFSIIYRCCEESELCQLMGHLTCNNKHCSKQQFTFDLRIKMAKFVFSRILRPEA